MNKIKKLIAALLTTTVGTNTAMSGVRVKAMSGVKGKAMSKRPALSCNTVDNYYADLVCVDLGSRSERTTGSFIIKPAEMSAKKLLTNYWRC